MHNAVDWDGGGAFRKIAEDDDFTPVHHEIPGILIEGYAQRWIVAVSKRWMRSTKCLPGTTSGRTEM